MLLASLGVKFSPLTILFYYDTFKTDAPRVPNKYMWPRFGVLIRGWGSGNIIGFSAFFKVKHCESTRIANCDSLGGPEKGRVRFTERL
jgi:hypothetical protein